MSFVPNRSGFNREVPSAMPDLADARKATRKPFAVRGLKDSPRCVVTLADAIGCYQSTMPPVSWSLVGGHETGQLGNANMLSANFTVVSKQGNFRF